MRDRWTAWSPFATNAGGRQGRLGWTDRDDSTDVTGAGPGEVTILAMAQPAVHSRPHVGRFWVAYVRDKHNINYEAPSCRLLIPK
jgi:hypothetical protein